MELGADLGLDNIRIDRQLGRGGFSVVYAGHDVRLDRPVAVKLLDPLADDRSRRLFDAGCRALGRLPLHPQTPRSAQSEADPSLRRWAAGR